jgi:hypothetical protein
VNEGKTLAEGIAAGELIEGTLRVSKHLPEEAVVRASGSARRCRLTLSNPRLKRLGIMLLKLTCD